MVQFRILAGLIFCNLVWSLNPAMGKFVLADFSPMEAAWLRYAGALFAYLIFTFIFIGIRSRSNGIRLVDFFFFPKTKGEVFVLFVLGFMAFCAAPLAQLFGLSFSSATENSLIISMEPLITVAMAWIFLGEAIGIPYFIAFLFCMAGIAMLSGVTDTGVGNFLILLSLIGEATFSVCGRKLSLSHKPVLVFGSGLFLGVCFLTFGISLFESPFSIISHTFTKMTWSSCLGVLWLGPLGTALTYLYWMIALKSISVADAALTLFIQPVIGVVCGYLFLGERLSLIQIGGGLLIVGSVFVVTRRANLISVTKRFFKGSHKKILPFLNLHFYT
ncbi:MAG: DMT family transporter [Bdellovibrionota bacterium]